MQVRGLPSLAGLAVNRLHPTVLTKAVPVDALMSSAGVQSIGDAKVPVQLVEAMPTQWQPWDAWNATSVTVTEDQVVVKLAPACGVMASVGLHMVCLQISYALDDACMSAAGEAGCQPSNFGCRLENPDAPGRCFVTTAPSRCIHYMVTDAGAAPVAHHTVSPPATPPPPPPPPAPALQPELVRVGEPDEPVLHGNTSVHHVLDFPRGLQLPDPHVQIKSGELSMYFAEDLGLVKLGQAPADSLRAVFDAQATACLCAGSRDLVLQRKLVDKWNKDQNTLDSASRNQWYKMGYELRGATVELDGAAYAWTCVAEVKLNVLKALSHETASEEASHACVLCWHLSDGHSCSPS